MNELDYINILKALQDIPFGVGKKLLIDFLKGKGDNISINRNKLYKKPGFGSMLYDSDELDEMIENLVHNGMIKVSKIDGKKFWKVLELTEPGKKEIENPELYKRRLAFCFKQNKTLITEEERMLFSALNDFLLRYTDEQKKAITSNKDHILCIAGAGSGKTTVLTRRIEFLVQYRSVDPSRILAVTFTRKARQEMMKRLPLSTVQIETFNSFCEHILRTNNNLIYPMRVRMLSYRDKIIMMNKALANLGLDMSKAIDIYFSYPQRRGKKDEELAAVFMNDCFLIRDYFKFKNRPVEEISFISADRNVRLVVAICKYIEDYMRREGLRDFADQLLDAMSFFENHPELAPRFDHILVDEYQDINSTQIRLLDLLNPENLFCVGDPRQSIYGWRGSDIRYILNFQDKYHGCEIITLTKNYRSTNHIVNLINHSIRDMGLPDLDFSVEGKKDIQLIQFDSEEGEFEFVIQNILESKITRSEIFVLARTNRQLDELSRLMTSRRIKHVVRTDEIRKSVIAQENDVTLATIHAIKGLEAKMVFVIGCNSMNFPCKGGDHPVVELIKVEEYDKEEEERRLFYVAMSRAKESLYLTYSGKKTTNFITENMLSILKGKKNRENVFGKFSSSKTSDVVNRLKEWRRSVSKQLGVPAFVVMHDRTLFDIAMSMPVDKEELKEIHGLGPTKIIRYGQDILKAVNG